MSTGGALNLSLLSRGVGEVSRNGHEKVDVIFEPQDYFNFVDSRRYYLPPIHSHVTFNTSQDISARSSGRPVQEIYLPKTFTTRKGALLLFSEDLAHRTRQADFRRQSHHKGSEQDSTDLLESAEDNDIKTVEDLTKSILSYGKQGKEREENDVYLKFVHSRRRDYFDRQIRPGFSAKRYLSTWTKSWDDSVLEKVISKGYLTEKSLFYYNPLLPHLSRRLNDDMSHYPAPYKLMRSMLMSPGSLSGYTFYRIRPESAETVEIAIEDGRATRVSIKVLSTKDGVQKEVTYASLDRKGQEEVLTDLLVKSAVHYAIKKQQEYMEEYMDVGVPTQVPIPEFDMKNAVESLLETEQYVAPQGTAILEPDFPEMDSRSQSSTYSGSFKGTRVKRKYSSHEKQEKVHSKAAQADRDERDDGDYDIRPNFTSSIPQLPPVPHGPNLVLTPIGEASREHTQALSLPPVMRNDDDEEDRWSAAVQEREYQQQLRRQREQDERRDRKAKHRAKVAQQNIEYDAVSAEGKGMLPSGGSQLLSSSESLVGGSSQSTSSKALHRPQGWKGSTQSLRSYGSRKGPGSTAEEGSLRGSIIFGPDGEAILIGGKIAPTHKHHDPLHISEVHYANKHHIRDTSDESDAEVPDEWRTRQRIQSEKLSENLMKYAHKRDEEEREVTPVENHRSEHGSSQPVSIASSVVESPKSSVTEKEIVHALTEHAQKIAENILSSQDAGQNLEKDIRRAAELWMETHPVRHISRSQSVQEVPNRTMIEEIMKNQKRNSAGPTVADYRDEIKKNLVTAITKAAGMEAGSIPLDAEIDPELMQALANQTLTPEDIEIIRDENGRSIIRSRTRMHQAMGGVKEGHIYMPATQANAGQRKISIPADRASIMDVGEPDVIHYGEKPIQETASEKGVSDKSPSERHPSPQTVSDKVSEKAQSLKGKSPVQSLKGQSQTVTGSVQGDASSRVSAATKSQVSFKGVELPEGDLAKTLADMEAAGPLGKEGAASLKSSKSGTSLKSSEEKSKVSDKSSKKEEKKEEFVVGRVDHTEENKRIYGVKTRKGKPKEKAKTSAVKKPEVKKAGKKAKGKKKEREVEESPPKEPSPEVMESTPPPPKGLTPKQQTPKSETPVEPEREETPVTVKSEEEEEDFIIVRDETYSPEPVVEPLQRVPSVASHTSEEDDSKAGQEEDESDQDLKMISNREARNAKRAAAAEKRRQEVERKRREREEQLKREKEEQERQEKMKQELEELRRKKEEERRLKKLQEDEEAEREALEAKELELRRQRELEREKRKKEEYAKKLEEMRKKQAEEEQRKAEEAEMRRLEEEEERKREAEMLAAMEEEERIEYEKRKQLEEEEKQKREAEEKRRREEEAQRAMELARKLAEEMARKQAELEARLRFNRSVQVESSGLEHTQDITRAFVFSYFELLQWLGLDIPELDLLKLNQY